MEEKDEEGIVGKENKKKEWVMKKCTDMGDSGGLIDGDMK